MMQPVLERFLRYVQYDTTSSEESSACPSTPGQLAFAEVLQKADYLVITLGHTLFKDNKKLIAEKPYYDCVGLME